MPFDSADPASRLGALEAVYQLYDDYTAGLTPACRRGCARCCTSNVPVTSLEARYLLDYLARTNRSALLKQLAGTGKRQHLRLQVTTNAMARLCAEGKPLPDEPNDPAWGRCPFLTQEACPLYAARPFGCRCLVSSTSCGSTGYATIDDFTLTVNTVFLQCIEHLDAGGLSGNLSIMLNHLDGVFGQVPRPSVKIPSELIPNSPLTILMIPPEHRDRITPWLEKLRKAMIPQPPAAGKTEGP
jgi:Fe-S-cluster containining protein